MIALIKWLNTRISPQFIINLTFQRVEAETPDKNLLPSPPKEMKTPEDLLLFRLYQVPRKSPRHELHAIKCCRVYLKQKGTCQSKWTGYCTFSVFPSIQRSFPFWDSIVRQALNEVYDFPFISSQSWTQMTISFPFHQYELVKLGYKAQARFLLYQAFSILV